MQIHEMTRRVSRFDSAKERVCVFNVRERGRVRERERERDRSVSHPEASHFLIANRAANSERRAWRKTRAELAAESRV